MNFFDRYHQIQTEANSLSKDKEILVIAVSKKHSFDTLDRAYREGIRDFGENSIKEGLSKIEAWRKQYNSNQDSELEEPRFHHIGPLQKGSLRKLFGNFYSTQGVGSESSLKELHKRSLKESSPLRFYLQINLTNEESKNGFSREELFTLLDHIRNYESENLIWEGFMTMGPSDGDPDSTRKVFSEMCRIRDEYDSNKKISMGMSGDYKIALEEGSDIIRVGTAIFGERNYEK